MIRDILSPQSVTLLTSRSSKEVEGTGSSQTCPILDMEGSSEKILSRLHVLQRGRLRWRERGKRFPKVTQSAFMMETGVGLRSPLEKNSPIPYISIRGLALLNIR